MEEKSLVPIEIRIEAIEKMGLYIARSGLFGLKTPDQAIALMLIAQAEGRHPALAARDYDIIQGKPALRAKAKLARFQLAGGTVAWHERTDTKASATFSHPRSPEPITVTWDMARAKQAGLGEKDNWRKYPRQMLSARVISEGVDATYPDAGSLMYVPEEVVDFEENGLNQPSPALSLPQSSPPETPIEPEKKRPGRPPKPRDEQPDARLLKGREMIRRVLKDRFQLDENDPGVISFFVDFVDNDKIDDMTLEKARFVYQQLTKDETPFIKYQKKESTNDNPPDMPPMPEETLR